MPNFPTSAVALNPEFLSDVLGKRVAACTSVPIGAGLVGDSARITIEYAEGEVGPASIAGKFPAADSTSRGTAEALKLYEKEVGFYQEVAPHIGTRTPETFFAEHDTQTGSFLLLMEDCGPAVQGDQLKSCTLKQAQSAICEMAALHGATHKQEQFASLDFLQVNPEIRAFAAAGYPGASAKFVAAYENRISPDLLDMIGIVGTQSAVMYAPDWNTHDCVIHGDFRLDNMLFDILDGSEPMVTLDWQTAALGNPLTDLGYFMGAGIGSTLRAANEESLLTLYRAELIKRGGPDLGDIRNTDGYAKGALHGVATAVFSATFVEENDRAKAIFGSMALGAIELVRDINGLRVLEK